MFVSFAIDRKPIETIEDWTAFVKQMSAVDQGSLLDDLKLQSGQKGLPNFRRQAKGETLLAWGRKNMSSYILLQEIKLVAE